MTLTTANLKQHIGFSGIRWLQYQDELDAFIALMQREGVRSYLETGAHHGDTMHAVGCALPEGSRIVGVDLPGATAGRYKDSWKSMQRAVHDLRSRGRDAHALIGDSHDPKVVKAAAALGPFDAVFIDGDHTAAGVRADWRDYGSLARIVGFHDISRAVETKKCGVQSFYRELCQTHRHAEFAYHDGWRGIGVVWRE